MDVTSHKVAITIPIPREWLEDFRPIWEAYGLLREKPSEPLSGISGPARVLEAARWPRSGHGSYGSGGGG